VYVFGVLEFDNPEPVVINGLNGENEYKLNPPVGVLYHSKLAGTY
jgi:hypothetical protein